MFAVLGKDDVSLLRLMQLVSPALPVGAYAYSQGMETAVDQGWVADERSAHEWLSGLLVHALAGTDLAVVARLHAAWRTGDSGRVDHWSRYLAACREAAEYRAEDRHLGQALARLLCTLGLNEAQPWRDCGHATFATLFTLAAARWEIPALAAVQGYAWTWLENQAMAAMKLVPLGQSAGQRILHGVAAEIPAAVAVGFAIADEDIGASAPRWAIAGAWHETQYSRLFQS